MCDDKWDRWNCKTSLYKRKFKTVDTMLNERHIFLQMFPPFVKKDRRLELYVPEICRSIYLEYDEEIKYEGIPGYRFRLPDKIFQKPEDNPENKCFCPEKKGPLEGSGCEHEGIWKIWTCKADVPIVISKPHYLGASDDLQTYGKKIGLSPDTELHDSYIDVEKVSKVNTVNAN